MAQPEPTPLEPGEPFETYLATVVLGAHLERLPEAERAAFVHDVASRLPRPEIDYVRLNILATRERPVRPGAETGRAGGPYRESDHVGCRFGPTSAELDGTAVRALRVIVVVAGLALVAAGCAGTGGGGYGYGGGVVERPRARPLPRRPPPTTADLARRPAVGGYTRATTAPGAAPRRARQGRRPPGPSALSGYAFVPATMSVATGASLTFTNGDATAHAIVIGENGTPASGQTPTAASRRASRSRSPSRRPARSS